MLARCEGGTGCFVNNFWKVENFPKVPVEKLNTKRIKENGLRIILNFAAAWNLNY